MFAPAPDVDENELVSVIADDVESGVSALAVAPLPLILSAHVQLPASHIKLSTHAVDGCRRPERSIEGCSPMAETASRRMRRRPRGPVGPKLAGAGRRSTDSGGEEGAPSLIVRSVRASWCGGSGELASSFGASQARREARKPKGRRH